MKVSLEFLLRMGIDPVMAEKHIEAIEAATARYEINTSTRLNYFLAQMAHETRGLTAMEENLHYTTPARILAVFGKRRFPNGEVPPRLVRNAPALANYVYANRYGNGPEESGDGWRYRGRGGCHLTFKSNYADAAAALGRPYVERPELVAEPEDAALTFGWYWDSRRCNEKADANNFDAVTRAINPAMAGNTDRRHWLHKAQRAHVVDIDNITSH